MQLSQAFQDLGMDTRDNYRMTLAREVRKQAVCQDLWRTAVDQLKTKSTGPFADLRRRSRMNIDHCQRLSGLGMVQAEQLHAICNEKEYEQICQAPRLGNVKRAPSAFWLAKYEDAPGHISGWSLWSDVFPTNHTAWWQVAAVRRRAAGLCCLWDPLRTAAAGTDAHLLVMSDPFAVLRMQLRQASAGEKELPLALLPDLPKFRVAHPAHTLNRKLVLAGETKKHQLLRAAITLDSVLWLPPANVRLDTGQRNAQLRKFQICCKNAKPWPQAFVAVTQRKSPQEIIRLTHELNLTQPAISTIVEHAPQFRPILMDTWQQVGEIEIFRFMCMQLTRRLGCIYKGGKLVTNAIVTVTEITEYAASATRYRGSVTYCGAHWTFDTYEELPRVFPRWLQAEISARGLPPCVIEQDWSAVLWQLMLRLSPDVKYVQGSSRVGWDATAQALLLPNGAIRLGTGWTSEERAVSSEPLPGSLITDSRYISGDAAKLLKTQTRAMQLYWLAQLYLLTHLISRPTLTELPPLALGIRDSSSWVLLQRIFSSLGFLPPVPLSATAAALRPGHDWPILIDRIKKFEHPLPVQNGFIAPMPWYAAEVLALTRPMFVMHCAAPTDDSISPEVGAAVTSHVLQELFTTNFSERYMTKWTYRNIWLKVRWQAKYAMLDAGSSGCTLIRACHSMMRPLDSKGWTTARALCRLMLRLVDLGLYKFVIADNTLKNIETPYTVAIMPDGSVLVPHRVIPKALRVDAGITVPTRQIAQQLRNENTLLETLRIPHVNAMFWRLPKKQWQAAATDLRRADLWSLRPKTKEWLNALWPVR